jgi:hypothetical protein
MKCIDKIYINLAYPRAAQIVAYHFPFNIQLLLLFFFSPMTPV